VAGALIGANTMYTAVINRIKEIATCRVLGFPRFDIFVSLMTESILLAVMGGIVGTLAGLLVNGLPLRISYGAFYLVVDWVVLAAGLGLSLLIGCAGGLFPIIKGLRMKVVEGLRYA
jgi:putative ABC transport system permease protein